MFHISLRTRHGHHKDSLRTLRLLSSPGGRFIVDNDDNDALCCVACHSNDVLLSGFFDNLVPCNVLQQFVGFDAVVIFFPLC